MGDPGHPVGFLLCTVNSEAGESSTASGGGGSAGRAWEVYFALQGQQENRVSSGC